RIGHKRTVDATLSAGVDLWVGHPEARPGAALVRRAEDTVQSAARIDDVGINDVVGGVIVHRQENSQRVRKAGERGSALPIYWGQVHASVDAEVTARRSAAAEGLRHPGVKPEGIARIGDQLADAGIRKTRSAVAGNPGKCDAVVGASVDTGQGSAQ